MLVAVEHNANHNDLLQAAWALAPAQFATALRRAGWEGRQDGVGSQAMFELLVGLHQLKDRGRRIDIVAFNGARDDEQRERFKHLPDQGPHEAAQAENIRRAAEAGRYDHVLVLVGNLHARKQPVTRRGVSFEPMAMRLAPAAAITSLNMAGAGGTKWNCVLKPGARLQPGQPLPPDLLDCGSHRPAVIPIFSGRPSSAWAPCRVPKTIPPTTASTGWARSTVLLPQCRGRSVAGQTFTSILPMLAPRNRSRNASGIASIPSRTVSRLVTLPAAIQPPMSR